MNDNLLVSVVIATYNMGNYLPEAVESVRAQTYRPLEVIIVDDGSTDDTATVIRRWENDPGVRYVWQENQGQTVAKNHGISLARGAYVAFLDGDDRWKPYKLEHQMPLFGQNPATGVVYSDAVFIDEQGHETGRREIAHPHGRVTSRLLEDNFVNFGSAVVSARALEHLGAFDEALPMSIDYDLWLRLSTAYEFGYVDEPLLEYRIWGGQMSHRMLARTDCVLRILDKFEREHPDCTGMRELQRARATTYASRAYARMTAGEGRRAALPEIARAVVLQPAYPRLWKDLVKILVGRAR